MDTKTIIYVAAAALILRVVIKVLFRVVKELGDENKGDKMDTSSEE